MVFGTVLDEWVLGGRALLASLQRVNRPHQRVLPLAASAISLEQMQGDAGFGSLGRERSEGGLGSFGVDVWKEDRGTLNNRTSPSFTSSWAAAFGRGNRSEKAARPDARRIMRRSYSIPSARDKPPQLLARPARAPRARAGMRSYRTNTVRVIRGLEPDLDRQLHLPLDRAAERARRARQHRRDRAVGGVADRRVRVAELRVVQDVERLDAESRSW